VRRPEAIQVNGTLRPNPDECGAGNCEFDDPLQDASLLPADGPMVTTADCCMLKKKTIFVGQVVVLLETICHSVGCLVFVVLPMKISW
jgi:hypothetical protein